MQADQPENADGRLTQQTFRDAAGRPEQVYILMLTGPTCLQGPEETDRVTHARTIQLYSSDDAIHGRLRRFIGKNVSVHGRAFGAMTVHHHAPIVMDVHTIDAR